MQASVTGMLEQLCLLVGSTGWHESSQVGCPLVPKPAPSSQDGTRMVLSGWKVAPEFGVTLAVLKSGRKGEAEGHRVVGKEGDRFAPPSLSVVTCL